MGGTVKPQKGIVCKFQHAGRGLSPWEIDEALDRFDIRGVAVGEDPASRLSFYDTEIWQIHQGWDDQTRKKVEDRLLSGNGFGTDYFLSERPRAQAPWPGYDKLGAQGRRTVEMVAEKIAQMTTDTGVDPEAVLQYERENLNREPVVKAVEALLQVPEPEPLIAA